MKVKILVSIAGSTFSYQPGEIATLTEKEGKQWIAGGIAEKIAAPKKKAAPAEADKPAPAKKKKAGK